MHSSAAIILLALPLETSVSTSSSRGDKASSPACSASSVATLRHDPFVTRVNETDAFRQVFSCGALEKVSASTSLEGAQHLCIARVRSLPK